MIKNQFQYKLTQTQVRKFRATANEVASSSDADPILLKLQIDALNSQADELEEQLKEYDALSSGKYSTLEVDSFADLPHNLIRARIALGLSQKDLGDRLGCKEQQVQRYENTEYAGASFKRLQSVIDALDLKIREDIFLPKKERIGAMFFNRLEEAGLSFDFLLHRIFSPDISQQLEQTGKACDNEGLIMQAAGTINQLFDMPIRALLGYEALSIGKDKTMLARFKLAAGRKEDYVTAYTIYAYKMANILLCATKKSALDFKLLAPYELAKEISSDDDTITLKSALTYIWNMGIPVLPLNDPGAFDGATWKKDNRSVIVLKHKTKFESLWLFDLFHELYHVGMHSEEREYSIIESSPSSHERRNSHEEQQANKFAADVLLNGRSSELVDSCFKEARGKVSYLKNSVINVAERENVSLSILAYQVANEAKARKINWWGAATNLQDNTNNPWLIAKNILFENIDLTSLNKTDRGLLERATTVSRCS